MRTLMNWMDKLRLLTKDPVMKDPGVAFLGFLALIFWCGGISSIGSEDWNLAAFSIIFAATLTIFAILTWRKPHSPERTIHNFAEQEPPDTQDNRPGKVYIVRAGQYYKIGITQGDVSRRIAQLQTGSPQKIHIVRIIETDHPQDLERDLHEMLRHKRVEGEWFKLSEAELRVIKRLE